MAGTESSSLAPSSSFNNNAAPANNYQGLILRLIKGSPEWARMPKDRAEEFLRKAELLFKQYLSYSRFPYNTQAAVQFVENKRPLIREIQRLYIESLGHLKRKKALLCRDGIKRLEELVKSKLEAFDYAVVDLMGRPGVGKSTVAGKMKKGFASLKPEEILIIPVDGFRNNDVELVNKLIGSRAVLNVPLKDISDDAYGILEKVSRSLQFPLIRDSERTFLDFYNVAEEREHETGENKRHFRRRKLWNHIGSNPRLQRNLDIPLKLLPGEDYDEILRIAREMRLDLGRVEKASGKSFLDIYEQIDNEEFLDSVNRREKSQGAIKLFVVEGTYSYQGEKIFDHSTERLMGKSQDCLIRVMIELDEKIREQRIRDRNRSDMEEMLILKPVFDAIFKGSIDLERESSDLVIDNTESTDLFQIKQTHSGVKAQFGIVTETARTTLALDMIEKQAPPDIYVLPPELFRGGRCYADIEFLMYYNFFIKGEKKVVIVGTTDQIERMKVFLKESLFGPDLDSIGWISGDLRKLLKNAWYHFAVRDKAKPSEVLPLEGFISFYVADVGSKVEINIEKADKTVPIEIEHVRAGLYSFKEVGYEPELVEVDYREPPDTNYQLSVEQQMALQRASQNIMAVTPMGSEDGFTPNGDYTNFIMWLEGLGIHVDPSPRSLIFLERAGIDPDDIPYVLLTHNHADHDSGLMRKILMKKRVRLLTTRIVYEGFVRKAKALLGEEFPVEKWVDWIELSEEKTNEITLPSGEKAYIDIRYNLHSIPTIGFILSYKGKRFGYSGDTLYDPQLISDWLRDGKLTQGQADKLLYFFWDRDGNPTVDLLFHEAGVFPLHTQFNKLCNMPEKIYDRLCVVHLSPARLKNRNELKGAVSTDQERHFAGLRQPALFNTEVLIPLDEDARKQILAKTLDGVSLLEHLTPEAKMELLNRGVVKTFGPGDPVIFEGDRGEFFYIILSGRAEVIVGGEKVIDASGKAWLLDGKPVWTYYPKNSFGEVALIDDKPRTASVRAVSNLRVLEIGRKDFQDLIYAPLAQKEKGSVLLRRIKYCIEKWIQRYSDSLIYNISDISLTQISQQVRHVTYARGGEIVAQGEAADAAYIVLSGKVGVYKDGKHVTGLSEADIFGEMALLETIRKGLPAFRNAACVAETDVEALEIDKELFAKLLNTYPGLDRGLQYEYRRRLLPHGMAHPPVPHRYTVVRKEKPSPPLRRDTEKMLRQRGRQLKDVDSLKADEKIAFFLNDIFGGLEFHSPEEFLEEFYDPESYRENFILFDQCLKGVFSSFQVQRFYNKFIEVSVYNGDNKKVVYRFVRKREKNVFRWVKESETAAAAELPNRPLNSVLINLESEKYEGVKGTPENIKTLQAYIEMYNPEANLSVIDCQWPENSLDFVIERIKVERPEMICISSTFGSLKELERLISAVRKMPYKPLIVVGGLTATWSHDYLLERYPEIICVQREGEEALSELMKAAYEGRVARGSIPNLIYIEEGNVKKNILQKVDLSRTPHPSRSSQLTRMRNAGFLLNSEGAYRGCAYGKCTFCTRTHGMARPLPVTRVMGDFEEYLRGGASFVVYADEDFLPEDPSALEEFVSRLETLKEQYRTDYFLENGAEPSDVSFYIATRARCIWREGDPEGNKARVRMLERLKNAGLVKIFLGVESGSPVQLKKTYNKEATLPEMKEAIKIIRDLGIQVVTGFITFDPVVTLGQLHENIRFVRDLRLVEADPLTEPINPFKQYRAQAGSPLVTSYRGIGLIASDHNPDTLMHDAVYRSKPLSLVMNIGDRWDGMISELEYALKGVVWNAEQSQEETERAGLFINLFNSFRERGYVLLEELRDALASSATDRGARIDMFFDSLSGFSREKILFELRRAIFPHTDVYKAIEGHVTGGKLDSAQTIEFLKGFFRGNLPQDWNFGDTPQGEYRAWIDDIAQDISLQMMSDEELDAVKRKLNGVLEKALKERLFRLEAFRDSNWRSYYSTSADSVERGIEFGSLLEEAINGHKDAIAGSEGIASYEESAPFHIYYRVSLKDYFQYRHPDISEPIGVLIGLLDLVRSRGKSADLHKAFLYPDGTLNCEGLNDADEAQNVKLIKGALRQIFLSSYDPFKKGQGIGPADFEAVLQKGHTALEGLRADLASLYRAYGNYTKKALISGGSIGFTRKTIDGVCETEAADVYGINVPASMKLEISQGDNLVAVAKELLNTKGNEQEYREGIMVLNAIVGILQASSDGKAMPWLDSICDLVDEALLPLTVYLPDTKEGADLAKNNRGVNFVFVHPLIYERLWPGIGPHLDDIMLIANPGILDDYPRMLDMIRSGKLRPDIAELIYEMFHNRVKPESYKRNENFDEAIRYTTNAMRVMPKKTPVLLIPQNDPLLSQHLSSTPPSFAINADGKARFLLHPHTYRKWKEEGVSFPRPNTDMEWVLTYPTASHRTLFVLGKERGQNLIGKVHSTIWAGPAMRRLKPDSVEHSFRVSERIRRPIDEGSLPEPIRKRFGYFTEEGFAFQDNGLYPEGVGVLYRSVNPYPEAAGRFLMPTFAAHNNAINVPENTADTPLTQLIDWNTKDTGEEPVDYFIREVLKPLYEIYFYYMFEQGFLLEPHGQNFFFEIDKDGKICRLVFKDWQSTMVDMRLRKAHGLSRDLSIVKHRLGEEASEATSLSIVFDHYWGNYLMKQVLEVLVNRYHGDKEKVFYRQLLLKKFKDVFAQMHEAYPQSQEEFPDVGLRHGKKPMTDRSNRVYFAVGGAPLFRPTTWEREIARLERNPSGRKDKVRVPVSKPVDENAVIQRQGDVPDEMVIDFERTQIRDDYIAVYPKNYDPAKRYKLLVALHGKGSHPARLMDIPEKVNGEDAIILIPKAPFKYGRGYTWFSEGSEDEYAMKQRSAQFIAKVTEDFKAGASNVDDVYILGISEGGFMAYTLGMQHPNLAKGIIVLNAPFRESYFRSEELVAVKPGAHPRVFIIQYENDTIVTPANAQRAEAFYNSKGVRPKVQHYFKGSHHKIDAEIGGDILGWIKTGNGSFSIRNIGEEEGLAVEMVERLVPAILLLLPEGDSEQNRLLRERFHMITSSLCYCLFQVELGKKDPSTKMDPALLDTVRWLEREAKSLLEELMELVKNGDSGKGSGRLEKLDASRSAS